MGGKLPHKHEQGDYGQVVVGQARIGQVIQGEQQRRGVPPIHGKKAGRTTY